MTLWLNDDVEELSKHTQQPLQEAILLAGIATLGSKEMAAISTSNLFSDVMPPTKQHRHIIEKRRRMGLTAEDISTAYQHYLGQSEAKQAKQGSYYTPKEMTDELTRQTLDPLITKALEEENPKRSLLSLSICDPACGSGHFLISAIEAMVVKGQKYGLAIERRDAARCVYGVDIDPTAVLLCRLQIWLLSGHDPIDQVLCDDALLRDQDKWKKQINEGSFHIILSNPPYIDSERMKKNTPLYRQQLSKKWSTARGNWDLYVPFVELGLRQLKNGGRAGFLTPIKLFGSDYCTHIQRELLKHHLETATLWDNVDAFENATVAVMTTVVEKGGQGSCSFYRRRKGKSHCCSEWSSKELACLPSGHWSLPYFGGPNISTVLTGTRLGDLVEIRDGATTGEAYQIRQFIHDRIPEKGDLKIVNTGLIDPHTILWGEKPIRYLGFRGLKPVIATRDLSQINPKRVFQANQAKVLVGGMGKRIEAVAVPSGVLCGKSAIQILPPKDLCPFAIAAWINSDWICELYAAMFQLRGMGKGALNIGPRQIKTLPIQGRYLKIGGKLSKWGKCLFKAPTDTELLQQVNQYCQKLYDSPKTD